MPEHLRALVVVMVIAIAVFMFARRPAISMGMDPQLFSRRRNLWFVVVLAAFLAHSFWLYLAVMAAAVSIHLRRDPNPLSVYALLVAAVPAFDMPVPGFGIVNYFFYISHVRLLNLVILLPLAWIIVINSSADTARRRPVADWFVIPLLLYMFIVQAANDSPTGTMRTAFYLVTDVWLPYFVFSRLLRDRRQFQDLFVAFILGLSVLALCAVLESVRGWLLFESLRHPLGVGAPPLMLYQARQEGGALRAMATLGSPIGLGYLMMIGIAWYASISAAARPKWASLTCGLVLCGGLVAALSRGPWVGAAAMLTIWICTGPGVGKRLAWLIAGGGTAMVAILLSPLAATVIDHLPFIGTVESGNIEYRQRLLEVSMIVFWQSPVFGSVDFLLNPILQQMRQGQGIIDMVNTYLQIALPYGALGLSLFTLAFMSTGWSVWLAGRKIAMHDPQAERIGRALLASLVGIMVTIGTVSSISLIPTMYWMTLAIGAAFGVYTPNSGRLAVHIRRKGDLAKKQQWSPLL